MSDEQLYSLGYVKKKDIDLLRNSGIRCKARPAFDNWWFAEVPMWVHEAMLLYRKHKKFAGLTEYEFIVKMRPVNPDLEE